MRTYVVTTILALAGVLFALVSRSDAWSRSGLDLGSKVAALEAQNTMLAADLAALQAQHAMHEMDALSHPPFLGLQYAIATVGVYPSMMGGGADFGLLGEIRLFPYNFVPGGFAACNGQLLPIASNTALFSLIGTIYGGDGITTFALPDLRGRVVRGVGTGPGLPPIILGQKGP